MQSLWMIAASLLFAGMGVCVKLASVRFSAAELVFYRGSIALVLLFAFVRLRGGSLTTRHWRHHLQRSIAGFLSLVMYFYAISTLPLATAVTLNYTAPLFLALLLVLWEKERVRPALALSLVVGFAGVILLLKPTLGSDQWFGGFMGLLSGMGASVAYYNVRQLGALGEPEWRTVFYFSLVSTLGGLPWALEGSGLHAVDARGALLLLGVGGLGALAQMAMTRAYSRGKTLATASLAYSTVVFSSLFGMLLWQDVLPWTSWLAIALIVASGALASMLPSRRLGMAAVAAD
ncbi:MAG: DMT family transporter [Rhodocyclaceae bacterium]|nr:DMT family transporter [Rhodocyclaceae bacterium]